ncbi:unnamed protein product [Lathyrus oleraceus]
MTCPTAQAEKDYDNHKWEVIHTFPVIWCVLLQLTVWNNFQTVSTPAVCKYWIKKYRRQVNYELQAIQINTSGAFESIILNFMLLCVQK